MQGSSRSSLGRASLAPTFAVIAAVGMGAPARADEANDIRAGEDLAAKICSRCQSSQNGPGHLLRRLQRGPTPPRTRCARS